MVTTVERLKLAELTSGVGALVLGIGLGVTFAQFLSAATGGLFITVIGLALHAFGMWDKRRLEGTTAAGSPSWVTAAYWLCWVLLLALAGILLRRAMVS